MLLDHKIDRSHCILSRYLRLTISFLLLHPLVQRSRLKLWMSECYQYRESFVWSPFITRHTKQIKTDTKKTILESWRSNNAWESWLVLRTWSLFQEPKWYHSSYQERHVRHDSRSPSSGKKMPIPGTAATREVTAGWYFAISSHWNFLSRENFLIDIWRFTSPG